MEPFPCYSRLAPESRRLVDTHAEAVRLQSGAELFGQGDRCAQVLFLGEGSVRVFRLHESGQEITLYFLGPGEQCNVNLNSAFTGTPAIGSAVADGPISGYLFPAEIVKQIYTAERDYQHYIFALFAKRLECMAGLVEDVRFKKLDDRLREWLHAQNTPRIPITHEKLAAHLGSSREVISRLLKELEHHGVVTLHRGMIELL
ncbi:MULTISPECIES: Crp/Fnr family transcriptional regulator [Sulfurimonas]|uniref:Crp/Fnr family transcriptional regulator n=1 Tax=Sulfurimonas diazotrophicus TaxID=3131939 RepID=A0ABZ3HEG9_9BACT